MPSTEVMEVKKKVVNEMDQIFESSGAYLFDYRGLTVAQMEKIRIGIKGLNGNVKVIKNRLAIKYFQNSDTVYGRDVFQGPMAVAYANEKFVEVAKALVDFERENEKLEIKAGFIEHTFADVAKVKEVAKLPPKEQLLAQLLGVIAMPLKKMGMALNAPLMNIAILMNNLKDKKEKEEKTNG